MPACDALLQVSFEPCAAQKIWPRSALVNQRNKQWTNGQLIFSPLTAVGLADLFV